MLVVEAGKFFFFVTVSLVFQQLYNSLRRCECNDKFRHTASLSTLVEVPVICSKETRLDREATDFLCKFKLAEPSSRSLQTKFSANSCSSLCTFLLGNRHSHSCISSRMIKQS